MSRFVHFTDTFGGDVWIDPSAVMNVRVDPHYYRRSPSDEKPHTAIGGIGGFVTVAESVEQVMAKLTR